MNEIERWIVDFFQARGAAVDKVEAPVLDVNYFERDLLDSLGIVQLIVGLESEFSVRLEATHMQDPRFCTIRGLGQIVQELRAG